MEAVNLTDDAKAILLLCGRFGKDEAAKPYTLKEYNRLTYWLRDINIRPADLLTVEASRHLASLPPDIDGERLRRLLGRGAAMALAVDKWTDHGLWVICRSDDVYPSRLKAHLRDQAPPILFGVGPAGLLNRGGLAVVGSRNVDAAGEEYTRRAAAACAAQGIPIVSGGARGVDQVAMLEALNTGGTVVGALADSLLKSAVAKKYRQGIRENRLVLTSPYSPEARFQIGTAMGRNKLIYALSDFALVISAEKEKGGTWAGAVEELKRETPRPIYVRAGADVPEGNRALVPLGARSFPEPPWSEGLAARLRAPLVAKKAATGVQRNLFGEPGMAPAAAGRVEEEPEVYSEMPPPVPDQTPLENKGDPGLSVFDAVLPVLLNALGDWQTAKDLTEALNVRKGQLDDWLKQALDNGLIKKKTRPVRYRRK